MTNLMQGSPPTADQQVTLANWRKPPFNVWSFQHVRELVPSADIANDPANVRALPAASASLDGLTVPDGDANLALAAVLDRTQTDGFVVLHHGKLVFEHYANAMTPQTPHILMSVSKSVLGLLAGILAEQGVLDPESLVTDHVPEVAATAYAGASVRDLLDMRAGILFDEDYLAAAGPIIEYRKSTNWDPQGPGQTPSDVRTFFTTLTQTDQPHGRPWHYVSTNTDLLGWVLERASGRRYPDLASELLWRPMGAENPAYMTVDRLGASRCAGGFCCTTRDLARIGLLFAEGGNGVVPRTWLDDIVTGGDKAAWEQGDSFDDYDRLPMRYRSKWYVLERPSPIVFGIGVFGQSLFIDRDNGMVIAKFSSQALPADLERKHLTIRAAEAIRDRLIGAG